MKIGRKRKTTESDKVISVQTVPKEKSDGLLAFSKYRGIGKVERELYSSLREAVPIIDAALHKIVRLIGNFEIKIEGKEPKRIVDDFVRNVNTNGMSKGIFSFLSSYLDNLLTYGEAVGEMVLSADGEEIYSLYNAGLNDVEIRAKDSPLNVVVCLKESGAVVPLKNQQLILVSLLNPESGTVKGTSVLKGLPFVSSILLRIFTSIKTNWERVGDIRFAVSYNPKSGEETISEENAKLIADEWKKAMRSDSVCDFVSAGDVSIKVIGAESQMPDCEIPIKFIMEQIIAKLGIPPFLLGISWSSTERMSEQQADILTSELEYYRSVLEPVINRIISTQLRLKGYNCDFEIEWSDINLQDTVELSKARLYNAQAMQIEAEMGEFSEK